SREASPRPRPVLEPVTTASFPERSGTVTASSTMVITPVLPESRGRSQASSASVQHGMPQGGELSPLLCNLNLHRIDPGLGIRTVVVSARWDGYLTVVCAVPTADQLRILVSRGR